MKCCLCQYLIVRNAGSERSLPRLVEKHLESCGRCRTCRQEQHGLVNALREAPHEASGPQPSPALHDAVMARVRAVSPGNPDRASSLRSPGHLLRVRMASVAALLVCLLAAGTLLVALARHQREKARAATHLAEWVAHGASFDRWSGPRLAGAMDTAVTTAFGTELDRLRHDVAGSAEFLLACLPPPDVSRKQTE